ncbi:hypothetical protein Y032_0005g2535 [Ancylostoma ceylanicum]|uniref:Receptor ligand binding region domain-containing protein n=3 Tax=Ancylostoma ceylanicum TaxID=53326 RepID=A0A016VU00_9BILA|nr:hypothetical protein Y032_0005g2535 [Ancylostoma ceylanicum]
MVGVMMNWWLVLLLCHSSAHASRKVPLRAFVDVSETDNATAHATIEMLRLAELTFNSRPDAVVDVLLGTRELPPLQRSTLMWNLNRIVCDEMKLGFMTMLAGTHTYNYGVYQAIADSMMVPLVDWEVSDVRSADAKRSPMTFSVRPPVDHILVDYIKYKGWSHVVYIHDGANADRTLHGMFEYLNGESPGYNVYVDNFRAPSDEEFFREFLNDFHRRMSLSQVKKDNISGDEGAESVRPVHVIVDLEGGYRMRMFLRALDESVLVKKEYHYVFANFEMEDADLASFHYSLINITGFQLFDRMDKKFLQNKKLFEDMYRERISTVDYLPASSAFAHDALLVAASALDRTVRKHGLSLFSSSFSRHQLFNRGLPGLYCRPHEDRDHPDRKFEPFEFGDEIAESIKEVLN